MWVAPTSQSPVNTLWVLEIALLRLNTLRSTIRLFAFWLLVKLFLVVQINNPHGYGTLQAIFSGCFPAGQVVRNQTVLSSSGRILGGLFARISWGGSDPRTREAILQNRKTPQATDPIQISHHSHPQAVEEPTHLGDCCISIWCANQKHVLLKSRVINNDFEISSFFSHKNGHHKGCPFYFQLVSFTTPENHRCCEYELASR